MNMALASFRKELNSIIREQNEALESNEQQHKENIRVIGKLVQDAHCCVKNNKATHNVERMKRPLSAILAEESKPVLLRSSRSAAKAAVSKIKNTLEFENTENNAKRRCVIKLERISVAQSVLDIISEEQEITDSSPEVRTTVAEESQILNEVHSHPCPVLPVHKDVLQERPEDQVICATVSDQPNSDLKQTCNEVDIGETESRSCTHHKSPPLSDVVANSTFVVDGIQSELRCDLPDVGDKQNSDSVQRSEKSQSDSLQNKICVASELHNTFTISGENPHTPSDKGKEGRQLDVPPRADVCKEQEGRTNEMNNGLSQQKLHIEDTSHQNEVTYMTLQKLIKDSPVRVTRTKTRALAQAAAAAATTTHTTEAVPESATNPVLPESANSIKFTKKKIKVCNKKELNGCSDSIISPPFQKPSNKTSPEDCMKENYNIPTEKLVNATLTKDLNSANRLKTPLSSNNSLSCSTIQSSKHNVMGMGNVISHCETFITKNTSKPVLAQINQKLLEDRKYQEEKVIEAEKKRERLLKEKAEQQRRNNEARAAKVAKTREQLERQRAMQQQQQGREREERLRIAQQKREEEAAFKRQMALQRAVEAEERRKQEEEQYLQALKKKEQEEAGRMAEKKALQLKKEAEEQSKIKEPEKMKKETKVKPAASGNKTATQMGNSVFNTNDIYSGEESEEEEITMKKVYPSWTAANRARIQLSYQEMCTSLLAQFFQSEKHTPDLIKIFGSVPHRALVRTSSAVWNTPPCNRSFK